MYKIVRRRALRPTVTQLEIEERALNKESDKLSQDRLQKLREEMENLKETERGMSARLESEKEAVNELSELKQERERLHFELENAQRRYDYETAAKLQYQDLPELERKIAEIRADMRSVAEKRGLLRS